MPTNQFEPAPNLPVNPAPALLPTAIPVAKTPAAAVDPALKQLASPRYNPTIQTLEQSFKLPSAAPAAAGAGALADAAAFGTLGLALLGGAALNLLFPSPTADEDQILVLRGRGGAPPSDPALHIGEPPTQIQPPTYLFLGGQSPVAYRGTYSMLQYRSPTSIVGGSGIFSAITGPIRGIRARPREEEAGQWSIEIQAVSGGGSYSPEPGWYRIGIVFERDYYKVEITNLNLYREDYQPDTGGNPPPTTPPIYSQPGQIQANPDRKKPEVGSNPSPPPPPPTPAPAPPTPQIAPPQPIPFSPVPEENKAPVPPQQPDQSTDTAPNIATTSPPAILYGPSSDPGSIKTIQPFSPAPLPAGQTFTPELTPDRSPQPKPQTLLKPKIEPTPEKPDIEKFRDKLNDIINNPGFGLVTVGTILRGITNNTNPEAIKNAAKAGTCESFNPGECNADIRKNTQDAANNSANNASLLERLLNGLSNLANLELLPKIDAKLGEQIPNGGIGGKLSRFINWSVGDRVVGMMSMIASVHNAFMLSNNVGQTLFSIFDNLGNIGSLILKPDGDANIDSKEWVTSNLDSLFSTMLGAEVWKSVKASYRAANNIFSTSSNMYDNLRSIHNDSQELLNMVRRDTAELGNALVEEGVISEDNWDIRDPKVKIKSKSLIRLQRMNEGLEALDNKLEAIEQMTSTLLSIAQTAKEVKENVDQLGKQLGDANTAFKDTRDKAIEALPDFDFDDLDLF